MRQELTTTFSKNVQPNGIAAVFDGLPSCALTPQKSHSVIEWLSNYFCIINGLGHLAGLKDYPPQCDLVEILHIW